MTSAAITQADLCVVGAGAAGLYCALQAAGRGARVALVSATPLAQTASYWAQGGVAAALALDDSPDAHLADTERAGRGLVRRSAAEVLVAEAPTHVARLQAFGVRFDADRQGRMALGLEGGHTQRRVVHAGGSATGRRIVRQLSALAAEHERITVLEGRRAASIWTEDGRAIGVLLEDGDAVLARATVMATGGAAALWRRTTNPPGSQGIGMMLAAQAGAELADLEFLQFHPTALIGVKGREGFLVTEAIRGEGAKLYGPDGERFVEELAPRDEVARAITLLLEKTGATHVSLDMRMVEPTQFPNVVSALRDAGIEPTKDLVPVAPASHYMMGGVVVDLYGRSTVDGLFAVGETSNTGLHGANRLASNSLSECLVWGSRAADAALDLPALAGDPARRPGPAQELPIPTREIRDEIWRCAGVLRDPALLGELLEAPLPMARWIAACALARTESRGAHQRRDHPEQDPSLDGLHTVVDPATGTARFEAWD
ncbi:MAG: FAD-dependent oxidoreductase [Solirubrobacteraceae bacterium]|nr:FAD-dependent oxidoreductase [Solirubrobacteraceae bacterium]